MVQKMPLVLGGHSFFSHLGNEPVPSETEQQAIVAACLDHGIRWFDTTHQPERIQLGKALKALGRRDEARIIAWNFLADLTDWQPGTPLDRPTVYRPEHIDQLRDELQTDFIDAVVIHELDHGTEDERQRMEALVLDWQAKGLVGQIGTWSPGVNAPDKFGSPNPYDFMVKPYNFKNQDSAGAFEACKQLGWTNLACSPFVRGWDLDKAVEGRLAEGGISDRDARADLADLLFRFALYGPHVDKLIFAARRVEWVDANAASARRGPLSQDELQRLQACCRFD